VTGRWQKSAATSTYVRSLEYERRAGARSAAGRPDQIPKFLQRANQLRKLHPAAVYRGNLDLRDQPPKLTPHAQSPRSGRPRGDDRLAQTFPLIAREQPSGLSQLAVRRLPAALPEPCPQHSGTAIRCISRNSTRVVALPECISRSSSDVIGPPEYGVATDGRLVDARRATTSARGPPLRASSLACRTRRGQRHFSVFRNEELSS